MISSGRSELSYCWGKNENHFNSDFMGNLHGGIVMNEKKIYTEKDCTHWTCNEDDENITADCLEDAIKSYLDDCANNEEEPAKEVVVYGHQPRDIGEHEFDVLENLLERLDDEYFNPDYHDGYGTEPTEKRKEAEKACIAVMREEYRTDWLENVCERAVNVGDYK